MIAITEIDVARLTAERDAALAELARARDTLAAIQAYADKRVARWAARSKKANDAQTLHIALTAEARAVTIEVTRLIKHGPRTSGGAQ
jgi:hypothetical protein